jgi:hypothetical protein
VTSRTRRALLAGVAVVLLLALGPFASPLVDQGASGVTDVTSVDHRNDVPVVKPARSSTMSPASRIPASRSVLVVTLVATLGLALTPVVRRRPDVLLEPDGAPSWSRPPHRGPPLLPAG